MLITYVIVSSPVDPDPEPTILPFQPEGDYVFVHRTEVEAIRELFVPQGITFTYIVVTNKSNNRMLKLAPNPADKPPRQNVTAGTIMLNEVNNPRFCEFILESHRCIQVSVFGWCWWQSGLSVFPHYSDGQLFLL